MLLIRDTTIMYPRTFTPIQRRRSASTTARLGGVQSKVRTWDYGVLRVLVLAAWATAEISGPDSREGSQLEFPVRQFS